MQKAIMQNHNHKSRVQSKPDLIEQIGGENQLNFVLISLCENINEEEELQLLFKHMSMDRLSAVMCTLIRTAFEDDVTRSDIILKNYAIFELGINTRHFKKLMAIFESALRDSWIETGVFEECTRRFAALGRVIEEEGRDFERAAIAQKKVETRILSAPLLV